MNGSEVWFDPEIGATIVNETGFSRDELRGELQDRDIANALTRWGSSIGHRPSRRGGMIERDRYVTPEKVFDQFRVALEAAENDDVVAGIVEATEALAFNKINMDCDDELEEDVWEQILDDIDLHSKIREMWRETFIVSQFYAGIVWGTKSYKVKRKTEKGNKSKKTFTNLKVPVGITLFDPLKVVPVGDSVFGANQLVYIANKDEAANIDNTLAGPNSSDQAVGQFLLGRYEPSRVEMQKIKEYTGAPNLDNLYLMNPQSCFRHTATKPDYQRFATVRMKSVFEILDMKHNLREMDRQFILGGTNFILLVKRGTKEQPAKQSEVNAMAGVVQGTARNPIIVSDHRLEIEIISPPIDNVLKPEKYNSLDARITARLYQMFMTGNYAAGASGDDSLKLARVIARGMESRRLRIAQTLMKQVFKVCYEANDAFTEMPRMSFHPKRIALDFDNNVATFLQDLRDRGDISRDTILSEVDIDQDEEARKREREDKKYNDIFTPTNVPFSGQGDSNNPESEDDSNQPAGNTKGAGRRGGGNNNGGGANRRSGVSQPGRGTVPESKVKNPGKKE